MYKWTKTDVET